MRRFALCFFLLVFSAVPLRASHKTFIETPAQRAAVEKLLAQANVLLAQKKTGPAMKDYLEADKISHHTCGACFLAMASIWQGVSNHSAAKKDAEKAIETAGNDKTLAAVAHMIHGVELARTANGSKDKKLKQAADDFRQALALDPLQTKARFDLGVILIREKKDAKGVALLKKYLAVTPITPVLAEQARLIIANPDRAREPYLPPFSLTALDGRQITDASLLGKVVLFDFWGTWCPPCRESAPMLGDIYKHYESRPVEILSISSDTNREKWLAFIAKHKMVWPQDLDLSDQMQNLFSVRAFPTFIVADRRGAILFRTDGYGQGVEAQIEDAIDNALKKKWQPAPSPPSPSSR